MEQDIKRRNYLLSCVETIVDMKNISEMQYVEDNYVSTGSLNLSYLLFYKIKYSSFLLFCIPNIFAPCPGQMNPHTKYFINRFSQTELWLIEKTKLHHIIKVMCTDMLPVTVQVQNQHKNSYQFSKVQTPQQVKFKSQSCTPHQFLGLEKGWKTLQHHPYRGGTSV